MKKIKIQLIFDITEIEKQSENFLALKNSILSGEFQREFSKNNIDLKYFKPERDYIAEKVKASININSLNPGFYQVIYNLNFNVSELGFNSSEFIEFRNSVEFGDMKKEFEADFIDSKNKTPEKCFKPKNLTITINII